MLYCTSKYTLLFAIIFIAMSAYGQTTYYITAPRVFDGNQLHENWALIVKADKIIAAGPATEMSTPAGATKINYPNATITPGLIEGHSHMLLYPYNIKEWDLQVAKETDEYRTIRATIHAKNTLLAGFTTARDLGSEGAGYADVALKKSIEDNIIIGPRLLVAGRAIVATGSYGPKGYDLDNQIMLGAEAADGMDLPRVVRDQIGKGADLIKVYADYRWGPNDEARPTFTLDELKLVNEITLSSGRVMVCHAKTKEAIRRAVLAGATTIEHGDDLDASTAQLMKQYGVVYIPTLAATESTSQYKGWKKGVEPEPEAVQNKRRAFKIAIGEGVIIGMGGDVGVFAHGNNVLEMELMVNYGMKPIDVLKAATSINAKAFQLDTAFGKIEKGMKADIAIFSGDPSKNISDCRNVLLVMKDGVIYRQEK
ncbi:MAG: amidohydrolase family protein [Sphingobacteriia bacterium]|nr:MAG: amidohydrolase family protein [Sphingobacteriia bacterium]